MKREGKDKYTHILLPWINGSIKKQNRKKKKQSRSRVEGEHDELSFLNVD